MKKTISINKNQVNSFKLFEGLRCGFENEEDMNVEKTNATKTPRFIVRFLNI